MGWLRTQTFHVEVFVSGSLLQTQPDVVDEVPALTSQFAVQHVMQVSGVDNAAVVYIRSRNREAWMHEVCLFPDGIEYNNPVERSL
jgi:hypothetical protein